MYYCTLLHKPDEELAKRFFKTQRLFKSKDDWVLQLEEDLKYCEIDLSEAEVQKMKQISFRKLVISKLKVKANEYLSKRRSKHSKSENLLSYTFQNNLTSEN